jgi:3-methyladenine DNA glycosylase AlkD
LSGIREHSIVTARATRRDVKTVVTSLRKLGRASVRESYARYGIVAPKSFGSAMNRIHRLAKEIGRDHALAEELWKSGWYEARLLVAFVGEPARLTPAQMERWARDFDNWAVCDTLCFHLFDRTPHALAMVRKWSRREEEFVRRAGLALLACVALHDQESDDAKFTPFLPRIEQVAGDERNFVKKAASWALRSMARRSAALKAKVATLAKRLAGSKGAAQRWIGKDVLRQIGR